MHLIQKYTEIGMKSIRLYLICLLLSSCSTVNVAPYKNLYNSFFDDKLDYLSKINKNVSLYEAANGDQFLANVIMQAEDTVQWKLKDKYFITKNGRIIQTSGFKNDIKLFSYNGIIDNGTSSAFIKFSSPSTSLLVVNFTYKTIKVIDRDNEYKIIRESVSIPSIKYSKENYYWYDRNGKIVKSKQYLDPFDGKTRIYYM